MPNFLDNYDPVDDRIHAFYADHPEGRITTELVKVDEERGGFMFKASVWRETYMSPGEYNDHPSATGYAMDSADALPPNMKVSALEVAETSAVGRALANLGYSPKGRRPSREEMAKVSGPSSAGEDVSASGKGGASESEEGPAHSGPSSGAYVRDETRRLVKR